MIRGASVVLTGVVLSALGGGRSASAYWSELPSATASVELAALGEPGATAAATQTSITVSVTAPASGPAPTAYLVSRESAFTCRLDAPSLTCPSDEIGVPGTLVSYTVTALLGTAWQRTITFAATTASPGPPVDAPLRQLPDPARVPSADPSAPTPSPSLSETPPEPPAEPLSEIPAETLSEAVSETVSETPAGTPSQTPAGAPAGTLASPTIVANAETVAVPPETASRRPAASREAVPSADPKLSADPKPYASPVVRTCG